MIYGSLSLFCDKLKFYTGVHFTEPSKSSYVLYQQAGHRILDPVQINASETNKTNLLDISIRVWTQVKETEYSKFKYFRACRWTDVPMMCCLLDSVCSIEPLRMDFEWHFTIWLPKSASNMLPEEALLSTRALVALSVEASTYPKQQQACPPYLSNFIKKGR